MNEASQLELLQRALCAAGVTLTVNANAVGQITLGKVYMRYRESRERGRSWQLERNLLRPFVVRFWRRVASSLGPDDWNEHRRLRRKENTRLGRPPCELSLNLELKAAKRLASGLKACRPVKTRTRRGSWFTADQIERLLGASDSLRWDHQQRTFRALISVMADTGLRISEALGLRWDRITLRGTTSVIGKGAKTRVVAFTPRALDAMTKLDRHENRPSVFLNWRTYKPYNPSTVRAWFRTAIETAGLEGVKADGDFALVPHILRHSFASIADARGAPLSWIQTAMGHKEASTTQVYVHRDDHDAAIRMAAIMGGRRSPRRAAWRNSLGMKKEIASATGKRVQA